LDITSKKIIPYFQPIIAVDTGAIYSYEVLGRYVDDDGSVKSLGPFFSDETVSNEKALEVDRIVRRSALEQYAREGISRDLFINLRLDWIAKYADKLEEIPTINWAKEFGISLSMLVFEITEEEFNEDNAVLNRVIAHYKRAGCRIAIDDYGKQASNIDRLAMLSPDILKINIDYIHKCEKSYHYREYLGNLSSFARRVGIEVLYEGIETPKQLDICIDSKGRYYQGFLLAKPQPSMLNAEVNYEVIKSSSYRSIMTLHEKADHMNTLRKHWDIFVERFFSTSKFNSSEDDINDFFSKMFLEVSSRSKRIYICNNRGEQLSYNIEMEAGKIKLKDYRQRNWAWRGFFQEAIIMISAGMKSNMTASYLDATTKEEIYTYTYAISDDMYLFIDIYHSKAMEIKEGQ
jgi:EAL domain-containing protein (putative c-di-GMP-specific phosphodiesterase class I)